MNENYAYCSKSRSNWKMFVGKLLMRGWKMPKFLHFQSTCKNGSLSFTMLKSPELFAEQWPGMLKVSYNGKILDLTPLWCYTSWDSQVTWWFQFLILREKRTKKSPNLIIQRLKLLPKTSKMFQSIKYVLWSRCFQSSYIKNCQRALGTKVW